MRGGFSAAAGGSFWRRYGARALAYVVGLGLFVLLGLELRASPPPATSAPGKTKP